MVPGVARISAPITAITGSWTASMRVRTRELMLMTTLRTPRRLAYSFMNVRPASRLAASVAGLMVALALGLMAAGSVSPPDQFIGFKVGADNKLARWDKIVDYMKAVAAGSDRVRL